VKKKGLGRGFESLIPTNLIDETFDPTSAQDGKLTSLKNIKIDKIQPDPNQPRRSFDEKALEELAASIKQHGIVQPLVVTPQGDGFVIVAGERRWRAAKLAEEKTVPCLVRTLSGQNRLEISLIENLQRRDLNPLETATAYLKLRDQFNMTLEEIGQRVGGKSISAVSNKLRLLKLPKSIQEAVFDGRLSEGQARPLIGMPEKVAKELMERIIREDWSSRKTEQWVTLWRQTDKQPNKRKKPAEQPHNEAVMQLRKRFNSKISVSANARGAGKIVIPFKSDEDFERIRKLLG